MYGKNTKTLCTSTPDSALDLKLKLKKFAVILLTKKEEEVTKPTLSELIPWQIPSHFVLTPKGASSWSLIFKPSSSSSIFAKCCCSSRTRSSSDLQRGPLQRHSLHQLPASDSWRTDPWIRCAPWWPLSNCCLWRSFFPAQNKGLPTWKASSSVQESMSIPSICSQTYLNTVGSTSLAQKVWHHWHLQATLLREEFSSARSAILAETWPRDPHVTRCGQVSGPLPDWHCGTLLMFSQSPDIHSASECFRASTLEAWDRSLNHFQTHSVSLSTSLASPLHWPDPLLLHRIFGPHMSHVSAANSISGICFSTVTPGLATCLCTSNQHTIFGHLGKGRLAATALA